jgi:dihydroceramidase
MYYWGQPDSLVSWCEEKYTVTNYVSEFKNTFSNLVYFAIPLIFTEKIYKSINFSIFLMGLGSILFHGTSRYIFQLCDEVPMIFVTSNLINLFGGQGRDLILFTRLCLAGYILFRMYDIFLFLFTSHILYLLHSAFNLTSRNKKARNYLYKSIGCMTSGKILWDIEQNYCDSYDWIYNLHSLWHFLSALSLYYIMKSHRQLLYIP